MKDWSLTSPIPFGSVITIKAPTKCQGPPMNTLFFSSSELNLKMNTLLPAHSTLNSLTDLHTCCIAALSPSILTPLLSTVLPTKQLTASFNPFSYVLSTKVILSFSSSCKVIALHFRMSSSVSITFNDINSQAVMTLVPTHKHSLPLNFLPTFNSSPTHNRNICFKGINKTLNK